MDRKLILGAAAIALGATVASSQEIATWAGFRKGAVSFTFDDGAPSQVTDGAPMFDKYGYKATFNLIVNWNPNWSGFQKMADTGHEIASHSDSHPNGTMPDSEIASSKSNIAGKITQKYGIITLAYPNCNMPNKNQVLQNYIVGRVCNAGWIGADDIISKDGPSDWAKTPALMTGSETGYVNTTKGYTDKMQSAIDKGGWMTFLTHGFAGKNNGSANYSPTNIDEMEGALKWAKQHDSEIWVAPFGYVVMYIKERKAAKIETVSGAAAGTMEFKLTHNIADNISKYDYPLSIRVKNSNNWSTVGASQNGKAIEASIKDGYIYFDAVPNGGNIVLSSDGSVVAPGSSASGETPSSSASASTPFKGAIAVPGTVEAENYDVDAFYHSNSESEVADYRTDNAGIVKAGAGYAVGYTTSGDYFEYTLDVKVAGKYKVAVNGATGNASAGSVTVAVGSSSTEVAVKNQGDWNTYSESEGDEIQLAAGKQTLRLTINNDNLNVDWIKLSTDAVIPAGSSSSAAVEPGSSDSNMAIANSIVLNVNPGVVKCSVFDMNGQLLKSVHTSVGSARDMWNRVNAGLGAGMYIMRYGEAGKTMQTVRVRK